MSLESGGLSATLTPLSPGYCLSGAGRGRGVTQCWFPQRGMSLPCQVRFVLGIRSRTRPGGVGGHTLSAVGSGGAGWTPVVRGSGRTET